MIRNDWTLSEIENIYHTPLLALMGRANAVHQKYHKLGEVQVCALLSIKTGGCSEDCSYCAQSVRYKTEVEVHAMMPLEEVVRRARKAKAYGATRFCMGAAWREVRDNRDFDKIVAMIQAVSEQGLEVCCTLGMLSAAQAQALKNAGLHAYNHNIDTSEDYYDKVITTRTFKDRLNTLEHVRDAGIAVCCGGIIGLGETHKDRTKMLHTLATLPAHPDSVPVNALVPIAGTPMAENELVPVWDMVRMIASARIIMPKTMVRLSAGREKMSVEEQALCFMSGANSIFAGEKLLTTPNTALATDEILFDTLGLKSLPAPLLADRNVEA